MHVRALLQNMGLPGAHEGRIPYHTISAFNTKTTWNMLTFPRGTLLGVAGQMVVLMVHGPLGHAQSNPAYATWTTVAEQTLNSNP